MSATTGFLLGMVFAWGVSLAFSALILATDLWSQRQARRRVAEREIERLLREVSVR